MIIIAEIGINHNGSVALALDLIKMAHDCGADFVKFQKRNVDVVYSTELAKPRESPWGSTYDEQKRGLEFGRSEYDKIDAYCRSLGIGWFASAWDFESLAFLEGYDPPHHKIASAMLTHADFVHRVAGLGRHTFISTGGASIGEIWDAVFHFEAEATPYTLMHCVAKYPCRDDETNIRMIETLKKEFGPSVGYSGHEVGLRPSVAAAVLGAVAIERHVTLDRSMYGSDQAASLERRGLELLVKDCKGMDAVLGDGEKVVSDDERECLKKLRWFEHG